MLERLIEDTACDLDLPGSKMEQLSKLLMALVLDRNSGGFSGFSAHFRNLGMQETFASWSLARPSQPMAFGEVKKVFGVPLIAGMGGKIGIGSVMTTRALCHLLPGIVRALSPDEEAPPAIPDFLRNRCVGTFEWLREMESAGWVAWRGQQSMRNDLDFPQPSRPSCKGDHDDTSRRMPKPTRASGLLAEPPFRA